MGRLLLMLLPSLALGEEVPWCAEKPMARCCAEVMPSGEDEYFVDEAWARTALERLSGPGCHFVPDFSHGEMIGLMLFPPPLFERIGIRSGDTVLALQGVPLLTPDLVDEAVRAAQGTRLVRIELMRRGERRRLWIHLISGCREGR